MSSEQQEDYLSSCWHEFIVPLKKSNYNSFIKGGIIISENFKELIKEKRATEFPKTFEIVHDAFLGLELDKENEKYFFDNASYIVERLRSENWNTFLKNEKTFSENIYQSLIKENIDELKTRDAVIEYISDNVDHFYTLSLSNTQSRRSRAGSEFEDIISHLFMGANLPFDEQGLIGTGIFSDKNLAKLVDHVVPGAIEYQINKRKTAAISAKTTLRERWQQIGDEMQRTKMPEMYLATLDEKIGKNTLEQLRANNIYPVTSKNIKEKYYNHNNLVLTFEELLKETRDKANLWRLSDFSDEQLEEKKQALEKAKEQHHNKEYVIKYIDRRLELIKKQIL